MPAANSRAQSARAWCAAGRNGAPLLVGAVEDVAEGSTVAVEDVAKGSMFAADAVEHEGIVFEAPGPLELDELMAVVARERALGLWTPTATPASFS